MTYYEEALMKTTCVVVFLKFLVLGFAFFDLMIFDASKETVKIAAEAEPYSPQLYY